MKHRGGQSYKRFTFLEYDTIFVLYSILLHNGSIIIYYDGASIRLATIRKIRWDEKTFFVSYWVTMLSCFVQNVTVFKNFFITLLSWSSFLVDMISVTRLGDFWQFLATKFLPKVAQIMCNYWGYFKKPHLYAKTAVATSWVAFGLLFASTSGHTGHDE